MIDDTVIEDRGKWEWSLVVSGDDVIARLPVAYDGATIYSTQERQNSPHKASEYGLDARDVVRRYVDESDTDRTFDELIDEVQTALLTHATVSEVSADA